MHARFTLHANPMPQIPPIGGGGGGKVLENPAVYAVHCREFPDHFNNFN